MNCPKESHLVNSKLGCLLLLKVDKAIALALSAGVHRHLAGQDVAEGTEGVVQGFVVNALVQVLDEDVAHTRLAESWVPVGPHDAQRLAIQRCVVQLLQSTLGCKVKAITDSISP